MSKRTFWDFIGKPFRRKEELPPGFDFCDNCGRMFPKEELHLVLGYGNDRLILCDECTDLPPSTWRKRYGKHRDE